MHTENTNVTPSIRQFVISYKDNTPRLKSIEIPSDKIDGKIRCNEVPYLEDDKVKLNVYTIKDQQKAYYKFVNKGESYFEFYYDFKNEWNAHSIFLY